MSRAQRLLELVQILRRHRRPVAAEWLASELEVSVRTVYRDIDALRAQGAKILGEAGVGYQLQPGFLLPPLMFSEDELEAIVLGLRWSVRQGDAVLARAARDALAKLRAVLPPELRMRLGATPLLAGPSTTRPPELVPLTEIRQTLRREHKARITYLDLRGRASTRVIWPLALAFFERARVVVAYCEARRDFRSFRADHIQSWLELSEALPQSRSALLREWRVREAIPAQIPD